LNPPDPITPERVAALEAELAAVKKRDAEFRVSMVQEFLDRGERNTYLHTLHEERTALRRREQESFADLELLVRKLEAANDRAAAAAAELARVRSSFSWRLTAPIRALRGLLGGRPQPAAPSGPERAPVEGARFTYYLHTSPFRVYRDASFTLRGWAWPADGRPITAVRVDLGGRTFIGRCGLPEPEVIARHGEQPGNPRPGFEVTFETPPGQHPLSLEAQIDGGAWRSIVRTTVWCEPRNP